MVEELKNLPTTLAGIRAAVKAGLITPEEGQKKIEACQSAADQITLKLSAEAIMDPAGTNFMPPAPVAPKCVTP